MAFYLKHFDITDRLHLQGLARSEVAALHRVQSDLQQAGSQCSRARQPFFIGDSIKVGVVFNERRLQFFTGIVTKIHGHKITLYQPGIERIFSYKNPQINTFLIMPGAQAVPKRRSKSRKILWRGAAAARLRRGPQRKIAPPPTTSR